jgi:hypothetical protein
VQKKEEEEKGPGGQQYFENKRHLDMLIGVSLDPLR